MSTTAPSALLATRLLARRGEGRGPLLYVAASERRAAEIARIAAALAPDATVLAFPAWDCLPYDRASPAADLMGRRMAVLRMLAGGTDRALVLATPEALLQRTAPRAVAAAIPSLRVGDVLDPPAFTAELVRLGYRADDRIDEPGEVAVREQVIDLYVASADHPCRIELSNGAVQELRRFDALTQRTTGDMDRVTVDAASEAVLDGDGEIAPGPGIEHALPELYPALETLFDALGPDARVILEPDADGRVRTLIEQLAGAHRDRLRWTGGSGEAAAARAVLPPERLYLSLEEWQARIADAEPAPVNDGEDFQTPRFAAERAPGRALSAFMREQAAAGRRIVLTATAPRDLRRMAASAQRTLETAPEAAADWRAVLAAAPGAVLTLSLDAERGFVDADAAVALVTAADVLGSRAASASTTLTVAAPWQVGDAEYAFGDLVIHQDHGVAILRGLETLDTEAAGRRETVRLDFARDAHLLVPVEELDRVWRYGAEDAAVTLDRLNTDAWDKKRQAIEGEIAVTARELVARARQRDDAVADKLVAPGAEYERFVARFPYPLTPDQASATESVLTDLASGRPMDRLVVGDVGFGKTEVAMRAAAAVALSGRQVALAAPTTVLVRQHMDSFRRRFEELGIEVAQLSRLASPAEAKRVKAGLDSGDIRVVVGTHALAAESVAFKELGLLILDEEQRFGAAAKEKLRSLAENLHVLTLTATPIPRTLQTALVGLQDLSTIATPPARRRPVRTFTESFDPAVVRAALTREQARGGQSFVVVPRIEDMEPMAARLKELVPSLSVVSAHGKLPAAEVDEVMVGFGEGRGDVLLATSIIESGLDVPRANTMIVGGADRFGLAQLHQLRGRVGRGRAQGFCYLTTDPESPVSEATAARLAALVALDRLGAGMAIAARDLDVRGAGDLMGEEQAGHMKLIGLGLYQHLLALAIRVARGEPVDDWTPEIRVEATGALPEAYIPEPALRLNLHARLARVATADEVDALADELEDRFGAPPPEVLERLALARLKALCRRWGVARIDAGPQAIAYTLRGDAPAREQLDRLAQVEDGFAWKKDRLIQSVATEQASERLAQAADLLGGLEEAD